MITEPSFSNGKILNDNAYAKLISEGNLVTMLLAFHRHTSISSQIETELRSIGWEVGVGFGVAVVVVVDLASGVVDKNTNLFSSTLAKTALSTMRELRWILVCFQLYPFCSNCYRCLSNNCLLSRSCFVISGFMVIDDWRSLFFDRVLRTSEKHRNFTRIGLGLWQFLWYFPSRK